MEQPSTYIPTAKEINVFDSLDQRSACRHFLGKTLEEAEKLFRLNSIHYQEDLMWMGPVAFRFYIYALIRYIESDFSHGDSDIINCTAGLLDYKLDYFPLEFGTTVKPLVSLCNYIEANYAKFDIDAEIYGDLKRRIHEIAVQLAAL